MLLQEGMSLQWLLRGEDLVINVIEWGADYRICMDRWQELLSFYCSWELGFAHRVLSTSPLVPLLLLPARSLYPFGASVFTTGRQSAGGCISDSA